MGSLEAREGFVVTGVMASGKSTVANLLARRYARGVHLRGDVFRKMIATGRDPIKPSLGREAVRQLDLRRHLAIQAANGYFDADFTVVLQDIYAGAALSDVIERLTISPLYVVVLNPRPEVVAAREALRAKTGYDDWTVAEHCARFESDTPRLGLWLLNSDQTPEESVSEIARRQAEARVR